MDSALHENEPQSAFDQTLIGRGQDNIVRTLRFRVNTLLIVWQGLGFKIEVVTGNRANSLEPCS